MQVQSTAEKPTRYLDCTRCLKSKSECAFYIQRSSKRGRKYYCKSCTFSEDRERKKKWSQENRDRERERVSNQRKRHPEMFRRASAVWRQRNPDRVKLHVDSRRARLLGAKSGVVIRSEVFEHDRGVCGLCREKVDMNLKFPEGGSPTIDHVVPLSKGGGHEYDNVQLAHLRCNLRKSNKIIGGTN